MSASNTSAFHLQSLLEKEKLNGANFMDWYATQELFSSKRKLSMFFWDRTLRASLVQVLQIAELMRSDAMMHSM
jgi:hypothetical protein